MSAIPPNVRYARQIRYSGIGSEGQARISQGRVTVVGVGALGCVIANHLARAGVGKLTLIDRDVVDASNLQRQLLYDEADAKAGAPKAVAASSRLSAVNSDIEIVPHVVDLSASNVERLLENTDIIVDGSDNFGVRYLMNEASVKLGIPWIYGGAVGASGMTATFRPGTDGPCFRCLFPEPPSGGSLDTCETTGVLAPIIDTIGSLQAMEAIKLLTGQEQKLHGSLVQVDLWHHGWQSLSIAQAGRPSCPVCAERRFELLSGSQDEPLTIALCGRNTVQVVPGRPPAAVGSQEPERLSLTRIAERWNRLGVVELNAFLLRLHLENGLVFTLFPDGRALVMGTDDPVRARRLYTELLGES